MGNLIQTFTGQNLPQWRGNTSSEDMNTNFNQIIYDLNTLFTECSVLVLDINTLANTVSNELSAVNARLYAVSGVMESYEASASGYKIFYEDFNLNSNITYPTSLPLQNQCIVDNGYGVCYLPTNNTFSQVYSENVINGNIQVAPNLIANSTAVNETGSLSVVDTSELNSFNGSDQPVWERDVQYNRDYVQPYVQCRLDVTMPSMTNPYVNRVGIKPYPEGTVNIVNVTYDTLISQGNILPNFPIGGIPTAAPTFFDCNNIQPTAFHVTLQQNNWNLTNGYKTFVYGLKQFEIENTTYSTTGYLGLQFTIPSYESGNIAQITSLSTFPNYDNIQYQVSLFTTLGEFNANIPIWSSSSSPITATNPLDITLYNTNTVWILVTLNELPNDAGSPVLESLTMTYNTTV